MAKNFSLGRNERLKSRRQIDLLFDEGKRFNSGLFRVFYAIYALKEPENHPLKAGFGASSRNFRTAVSRNRIRRLSREAWRLQKNSLHQQLEKQKLRLDVFFIYTGKDLPVFAAVAENIKTIINRLQTLVTRSS